MPWYRLFKRDEVGMSFSGLADSKMLMSSQNLEHIYETISRGEFEVTRTSQVVDKVESVDISMGYSMQYVTVHLMGLPGLKEVYIVVCEDDGDDTDDSDTNKIDTKS